MKPYLNIDPGDPPAADDVDTELFEDGASNPEVLLSVTAGHRAYPENGPHHAIEPQEQHQRRIDELRATEMTNEPILDRFEPRYSPIDPKGSRGMPTGVKVLGALIAIALIAFVAFGGWLLGTNSSVASYDKAVTKSEQSEKSNKVE